MKKLLVLSMVLASFVSYGQNRTNKLEIIWCENYTPLTNAVGWVQNEKSGKWVSGINLIKDEFYEIEYNNQFNSIQFRGFNYKEQKYYALVIKKVGVYWDYPALGRGFHTFPKTLVYILNNEEFDKLKNITSECVLKTNIAGDNMEYEQGNETFIKNSIRTYLEDKRDNYGYYDYFKIIKTKSNGKDTYRFKLPETTDKENDIDFTKMYFETPTINQFTTLVKK